MKKLHLVCNAHLDPVWMWDFDEGIAAALSTFRTAAEFCEEYDYIFCHNEVLLYEYIEQYDPELFKKIQKLVSEGKWHIMGGWYCQPDCHLPSGESFVRQMKSGSEYFLKKFGVMPKTAINFDSFGHSRGLVQILKKCGFDNYLICRPMPQYLELPSDEFNWIGYDGSKIKTCRIADDFMYETKLSQAKEYILKKTPSWEKYDVGIALWGVGNHGGNPSRKDLKDVNELIAETKDYEILHSTPDLFFDDVNTNVDYKGHLSHFHIGCYTSLIDLKQKHIELENELYMTEKLCSAAELNGMRVWNAEDFSESEKALLTMEFHDSLSGTIVESAEKSVIAHADHALHILKQLKQKAFFAMVNRKVKAGDGEYPIFVFNPSSYNRDGIIECEILILNSLISDEECYKLTVRHNGIEIPFQVIKEESNINYDRRKRIVIKSSLPPLSIDRFDVSVSIAPKTIEVCNDCGDIVFEDSCKRIVISKNTGLIESYNVNGKEYLSGGAFLPVMYDDIPDSWGWDIEKIGGNPVNAVLFNEGVFEGLKNVHITEQGDILTMVESFFKVGNSTVCVKYKLYKDLPYIDLDLEVLWNETEKCLKIKIPSQLGEFIGQTAYGTDVFERDGRENVAQRFMALRSEDASLTLYNKCVYGCSADKDAMYITLIRGIGYCVHPIEDRILISHDGHIPFPEQGKHKYSFRFGVNKPEYNDRLAREFCEVPYCVNAFPDGLGAEDIPIVVESPEITLSALYKQDNKFVFRLFNNNDKSVKTTVSVGDAVASVEFGRFEIKTIEFKDGAFMEKNSCF